MSQTQPSLRFAATTVHDSTPCRSINSALNSFNVVTEASSHTPNTTWRRTLLVLQALSRKKPENNDSGMHIILVLESASSLFF
ncbi:hypothetical protein RYX36_023645 [Vicia faba]